mgnify:CR=1 FL=1
MPHPAHKPKPVTLARVERALDRLAVIMVDDPAIAEELVPLFDLLEEEAARLRAESDSLQRARERARRSRDRTATRSA